MAGPINNLLRGAVNGGEGSIAAAGRMSGNAKFGMDAATKAMTKYSTRNSEEGLFDVIGHGTPDSLSGQGAAEIAAKIKHASAGQGIRLLSCRTGSPRGTFAQDLADALGVRVKAPTTDIGASSSGKSITIFDGGEWKWFEPKR